MEGWGQAKCAHQPLQQGTGRTRHETIMNYNSPLWNACIIGPPTLRGLFSNEGKIWSNLASIWRGRWWWQCHDRQHLNAVPVFKNVIKTQFATWFISRYKAMSGVVNRATLDNFPQLFGHTLKIWSTAMSVHCPVSVIKWVNCGKVDLNLELIRISHLDICWLRG